MNREQTRYEETEEEKEEDDEQRSTPGNQKTQKGSHLKSLRVQWTLTHVLLLVVAVLLCFVAWQLWEINRTLRAIDCDMPDLPCQQHY